MSQTNERIFRFVENKYQEFLQQLRAVKISIEELNLNKGTLDDYTKRVDDQVSLEAKIKFAEEILKLEE